MTRYWITFEDLDREDDYIANADGYLIMNGEIAFYSLEKGIIHIYQTSEVLTITTVVTVS